MYNMPGAVVPVAPVAQPVPRVNNREPGAAANHAVVPVAPVAQPVLHARNDNNRGPGYVDGGHKKRRTKHHKTKSRKRRTTKSRKHRR